MQAVTIFEAYSNSFSGTLPVDGSRAITAVTKLLLYINSFTGMIPEGLYNMLALTEVGISSNRFTGALPHNAFRAVTFLAIHQNSFSGMLPGYGIHAMSAVITFFVAINRFSGALPASGIKAMTAVRGFAIFRNSFTGALPDDGIGAMQAVTEFGIWLNQFTGTLPEKGLCGFGSVTKLDTSGNGFKGTLPDYGIIAMRSVKDCKVHSNSFTGTLPDGIGGMMAVTTFNLGDNCFTGALPVRGVSSLKAVSTFGALENLFTGTLPHGIRAMTAVTNFDATMNCFTGSLPDGFGSMTAMIRLLFGQCRLAGALPATLGRLNLLSMLVLPDNYLTGSIPKSASPEGMSMFIVSRNQLEGALPRRLFAVRQSDKAKFVATSEMTQEGTIPESISRMTLEEVLVTLGHSLRGLLPLIRATLTLLSVWQNSLEGLLPDLHISPASQVFVHANEFSCKLPVHGGVKPYISLSLIGNRFAQPRKLPAWITSQEQPAGMFCVSNRQGKTFLMVVLCTSCLFILAISSRLTKIGRDRSMYGQFALAKSAWHETGKLQVHLLLVSCALLALHSDMESIACPVVVHHLRLHFRETRRRLVAPPVAWAHMWTCQLGVLFYRRHTWHRCHAMAVQSADSAESTVRLHSPVVAGSKIHSLWLFLCVLAGTPGVLYSTINAVPGFLHMSASLQWMLNSVVSLYSGLVTGIALPMLAAQLWKLSGCEVDIATLQLVGLLLASITLPGLAAVMCDVECLGGWTYFWTPCIQTGPFLGGMLPVSDKWSAATGYYLRAQAVYRTDMCSLQWQMDWKGCMESVMERLSWVLYPKFTHYCFTVTTYRMLRRTLQAGRRQLGAGGKMKLTDVSVLLSYTWLVVMLLGPYMPILNVLIALLVKIYSLLLFSSDLHLLDEKQGARASAPSTGLSSVALLALVLQGINLSQVSS